MARADAVTRKSARLVPFALVLLLAALAVGAAVIARNSSAPAAAPALSGTATTSSSPSSKPDALAAPAGSTTTTPRGASTTTSAPGTTVPPSTTTTTTTPLPPAGAGFVAGHVTAIGDSVMLDYQDPLQTDIPGIDVQAAVSRQWSEGESILQELKASGQLGSEVIVALSTNGPIAASDFDNMMAILSGASRVVFVNIHVDQPWQDPNNAVIAAGAARYPNVYVADWATSGRPEPAMVRRRRHTPGDRRVRRRRARQSHHKHPEQRVRGKGSGTATKSIEAFETGPHCVGQLAGDGRSTVGFKPHLRGYSSVG